MKAVWKGETIAASSNTVVVEGNHYFPSESLNTELVRESDTTTECVWKGTANYYTLIVGEQTNPDAVWYYADPKDAAKQTRDRVAFWKGVEVE